MTMGDLGVQNWVVSTFGEGDLNWIVADRFYFILNLLYVIRYWYSKNILFILIAAFPLKKLTESVSC